MPPGALWNCKEGTTRSFLLPPSRNHDEVLLRVLWEERRPLGFRRSALHRSSRSTGGQRARGAPQSTCPRGAPGRARGREAGMDVPASSRLSATWPRDCGRRAPTGAAKRLRQQKEGRRSVPTPLPPKARHAGPGCGANSVTRGDPGATAPCCCATPCPAEWVCDGEGEGGRRRRTLQPEVLEGRNGGKSAWARGFSARAPLPAAGALAVGKDREDCATSVDRTSMKRLLLAVWFFILPASWAAPKNSSGRPEISHNSMDQPILNPLHPGQDSLKVLQDYLENIGHVDGDAAAMTREQALLLLFALHDYDKSGRLDGLEFMRLLSELVSQQAKGQPAPHLVVPMVDSILETQDFNWDGLLEPSELFLPPRQGKNPGFLTPRSEDGTVLWALPKPNEQATGSPSPSDQQSTGGSPAAPAVDKEQEVMEDLLLSPQKHGGGPGQETAADPDQQGEELPSAPGD